MKEKRLLPLLAVLLAIPFTAAAQRPNVILILSLIHISEPTRPY